MFKAYALVEALVVVGHFRLVPLSGSNTPPDPTRCTVCCNISHPILNISQREANVLWVAWLRTVYCSSCATCFTLLVIDPCLDWINDHRFEWQVVNRALHA